MGRAEVNVAGFLFDKSEGAGAFQAGKPVDDIRRGQALGEPAPPPVVADSSSHSVEARAVGIVPAVGPDGKPLPTPPQSQNIAWLPGNAVHPEAAKGAVAATTPATVSPPAASEPTRERLVEASPDRLVPSAPLALIEAAPIKSPQIVLEPGAARSDGSDKSADTKASKVTLTGATTILGAREALAKAPGFAFASPSPDAAAAGSESHNYHWGYAGSTQTGQARSDGEKVPILGDVPRVVSHYWRQSEGELMRGRSGAQAGTPMTLAKNGQQDGVALHFAGTTPALDRYDRSVNGALANQPAAKMPFPEDAGRSVQRQIANVQDDLLGAQRELLERKAMQGDQAQGAGSVKNKIAAGALRMNVEEKPKSVELALKLDAVASGVEKFHNDFQVANGVALPPKQPMTAETPRLWDRSSTDGKARADTYLAAKSELAELQRFRQIGVKSDQPGEAAKIANAVAEEYKVHRAEQSAQLARGGIKALEERFGEQDQKVREAQKKVDDLRAKLGISDAMASGNGPSPLMTVNRLPKLESLRTEDKADVAAPKPAAPAAIPQPEVQTSDNAFSTFSLNVSDVSFKLAGASLEKGLMPEPATVRSEEFINAFDYRDPEPPPGVPVAFAWERAQYPFAQNRDLLRFSIKTAALGRQPGRPLNLVLLLDNSGSMERADRVRIIREALRVLAEQLQPQDKLSVVTFARTPRLFADGAPGNDAGAIADGID